MYRTFVLFALAVFATLVAPPAGAQQMETHLLAEDRAKLAADAVKLGDARRGAVLFHRPETTCAKCHLRDARGSDVAPDLTKPPKKLTPLEFVESVLLPSKEIRKGFEVLTFRTNRGKSVQGILVQKEPNALVLRKPDGTGERFELKIADIDRQSKAMLSGMPKGLVNQLSTRQEFLDLIKYVMTIGAGGPQVARDLRPPEHLLQPRPLPEYEKRVDHAGMIRELGRAHLQRGKAIYERLCINCHGTKDKQGSLPTALRFAEGKFKNGNDPFAMYRTLTRGFGLMAPQHWMVPQQKYDVIHYIREAYLKPHNKTQYTEVGDAYLSDLPKGNTRGPAPRSIQPWVTMDYGYALINTYEIPGSQKPNFAYKGIAVRLDPGSGGVSRGKHWAVFDHDTMRIAAIWSADPNAKDRFIDYNGIHFNGRHAIHPKVIGDVVLRNIGPGWANPQTGKFDDLRLKGRDGRLYGPLPQTWAKYHGLHLHNGRAVISYSVGTTKLLEMPGYQTAKETGEVFTRRFEIGPREKEMLLQIAEQPGNSGLRVLNGGSAVVFGAENSGDAPAPAPVAKLQFDGRTYLEVNNSKTFDLDRDFTIAARIKTRKGGTILARTKAGSEWVPGGRVFFVRGGRLTFDIGWVGMVRGRKRVADGKWHDVAMSYEAMTGRVQFFVDGKPDGGGTLKPKRKENRHTVRVGFAAPDFPKPSYFTGDLTNVAFYPRALAPADFDANNTARIDIITSAKQKKSKPLFRVVRGSAPAAKASDGPLVVGVSPAVPGVKFETKDGRLTLRIPAGDSPLRFSVWITRPEKKVDAAALAGQVVVPTVDLKAKTNGGSPWWSRVLTTQRENGKDDGPLAVDLLKLPINNPWHCRLRLTGLDFAPDGKSIYVSAWDGSIWHITGLNKGPLKWKRFAAGLFQPLGVKLVKGKIYVTCRDQLVILEDLNNDGEADYFRCFNNDHQVTDHFHEFAMGLQADSKGNFYYAKSARHAKTALVPHHGTLLKVSADGSKTTILANGFRAANGVCLNPDGTFFVTDQEGHWTPKNRINHVRIGGFYGNMMGYHDVKDSADSAMQQPLCWITNRFDRSPAELMWVDAKGWKPLDGKLISLSYGEGKIYTVTMEQVGKITQGGMSPLPIPVFPTGVMRGRFHPATSELYLCGMFAWAGNRHKPGGLYVLRRTNKELCVISDIKTASETLKVTFSVPLEKQTAESSQSWNLRLWDLKRGPNYGSKHYNERTVKVTKAVLSADGKAVTLTVPDLKPTWCYAIRWEGRTQAGNKVERELHGTIHQLGK